MNAAEKRSAFHIAHRENVADHPRLRHIGNYFHVHAGALGNADVGHFSGSENGQFLYVLDGAGRFYANGNVSEVRPGTVIEVMPHTEYGFIPSPATRMDVRVIPHRA